MYNFGGTSASWAYDAAGNCLTNMGSGVTNSATYDVDNELLVWSTMSVTQNVIRGQVSPGPRSNKWYNTWAMAGGRSARVNPTNGSFEIPAVPMQAGSNTIAVVVKDVSGNSATQSVSFLKQSSAGQFCYYDANGNLTSATSASYVVNYSYDFENRLISMTSNGVQVLQCWYDGVGRRIAKKEISGGTTNAVMYVYDGWNVMAVLNQQGQLLEHYTRGPGLGGDIGTLIAETRFSGGTATNTVYYHNNHRGDVTAVRSGTSTVATFDYTAFGDLRSSTGSYSSRFRFSSKELDQATGLYYYGYRFYAPALNRWLTQDPLKEAGGLNQYVFCGNNSICLIDYYGEWARPPQPQKRLRDLRQQRDEVLKEIDKLNKMGEKAQKTAAWLCKAHHFATKLDEIGELIMDLDKQINGRVQLHEFPSFANRWVQRSNWGLDLSQDPNYARAGGNTSGVTREKPCDKQQLQNLDELPPSAPSPKR